MGHPSGQIWHIFLIFKVRVTVVFIYFNVPSEKIVKIYLRTYIGMFKEFNFLALHGDLSLISV